MRDHGFHQCLGLQWPGLHMPLILSDAAFMCLPPTKMDVLSRQEPQPAPGAMTHLFVQQDGEYPAKELYKELLYDSKGEGRIYNL